MNYTSNIRVGFHALHDLQITRAPVASKIRIRSEYSYKFENFFHPFVGEMIERLNEGEIKGVLDPNFVASLRQDFFQAAYAPPFDATRRSAFFAKEVDLTTGGPYANYNWEFFFHIPLAIAVHLSKNQRFAEAQRWFHLIFDPTANDTAPAGENPHWRFLAFRRADGGRQIDEMLALLSKPEAECDDEELQVKASLLEAFDDIRERPFRPHVVARTRPIAYMYQVVMKYLDNLIAWGDHLFRLDTMESINECTQIIVLAANVLGERPQEIPERGRIRPKSFAQLRAAGLDASGNALVALEGQFPFNLSGVSASAAQPSASPLLGIGRTLYFCVPRNDRLLSYWDIVGDRLFKIRNCMNIAGVVRPLALFDPPIDPGLLVKAVAAGIDIGSAVAGLNQPAGPLKALPMIQKALEICAEVRSMGASLLLAIEKGDSEHLGQMRQSHEIKIATMQTEARFLQWKAAEENTEGLMKSRASSLERYRYYMRLLGREVDSNLTPNALPLDRRVLTAENFDEAYCAFIAAYEKVVPGLDYQTRPISGEESPAGDASALGISTTEADEISNLGTARDLGLAASIVDATGIAAAFIPNAKVNLHYWGLGGTMDLNVGSGVLKGIEIASKILRMTGDWHRDQAGIHNRSAGHQRRADDWTLQVNLAAKELQSAGRQILASLIGEQIALKEKETAEQQAANAREVYQFLHDKFSDEELYGWMQSELSRLYYEYYRFAFDLARRAEQTMKRELMRPELDQQTMIRFNYWNGGRKGLLAGENLFLDVKRMEAAYHDYNQREYELIKHVSLLQLDPLALIQLRTTGRCQLRIPEAVFDLDGAGHYFRRLKSVAISIPSVTGPHVSVNCRLMLLKSSIRTSSLTEGDGYLRTGPEDSRFVDFPGGGQAIVASSAYQDTGVFEASGRDDRPLPFEHAGAIGEWQLALPANPAKGEPTVFDYRTISDVVLHLRYFAREGGDGLRKAAFDEIMAPSEPSPSARLFSLRHEFPTEWAKFTAAAAAGQRHELKLKLRPEHFPYWSLGRIRELTEVQLFARSKGGSRDVNVADRAKVSDGAAKIDTLTNDPSLGMAFGRLSKIRLPDVPTAEEPAEIALYFDKADLEDVWMTVGWTS